MHFGRILVHIEIIICLSFYFFWNRRGCPWPLVFSIRCEHREHMWRRNSYVAENYLLQQQFVQLHGWKLRRDLCPGVVYFKINLYSLTKKKDVAPMSKRWEKRNFSSMLSAEDRWCMVIGIQVGKCLQKTLLNVIYSLFNLPIFCVTLRYIRKILA